MEKHKDNVVKLMIETVKYLDFLEEATPYTTKPKFIEEMHKEFKLLLTTKVNILKKISNYQLDSIINKHVSRGRRYEKKNINKIYSQSNRLQKLKDKLVDYRKLLVTLPKRKGGREIIEARINACSDELKDLINRYASKLNYLRVLMYINQTNIEINNDRMDIKPIEHISISKYYTKYEINEISEANRTNKTNKKNKENNFKMPLEMFSNMIEMIITELKTDHKKSKDLEKILGQDSYIVMDNNLVDNLIILLEEHFDDSKEWISWLIWEVLMDDNEMYFYIDEVEYKGTIENVYNYCLIKE